jgi:four helix bundle protein
MFRQRTKKFAVAVIKLCEELPRSVVNFTVVQQIVASATSVGANYRAACRARSQAEFFSKISIVVEEADETQYWLEVIDETGWIKSEKIQPLHKECSEILAVVTKARDTTSENRNKPK